MVADIARKYFTVSDYYRMAETGIIKEDERVELLNGEIVQMSPIGSHHTACVTRLYTSLIRLLGNNAIVWAQNPISLSELSEPVPDVSLLKPRPDFYAERHPLPSEVLLLIEVSDSTLRYDRRVKVPSYAQAGISEVWVVNLQEQIIEVYTNLVDGTFKQHRRVNKSEVLTLPGFPDISLAVSDILG